MKQVSKVFCALLLVCTWLLCPVPSAVAQGGLDQRVSELSQKISTGLTENQKRTIAVVEFADLRGNVTDFGRFIAEELITHLYETKKFKVIERQLLNKVITEQKLALTGIVDPSSAQKLGRLLGVDAIAAGTVTDLGKTLRINARLIDTSTAEIFAVASTEIVKDEAVTKLMGSVEPTSTSTPRRDAPRSWRVDSNFFTFEIQKCRRSGESVSCDFTITNNDRDRDIGFYIEDGQGSGIKFFDNSNVAYNLYQIELPTKLHMSKTFCCYTGYIFLVSGVHTKGRLLFNRVSQDATTIMLLTIHARAGEGNGSDFKVEFRNIPLGES